MIKNKKINKQSRQNMDAMETSSYLSFVTRHTGLFENKPQIKLRTFAN